MSPFLIIWLACTEGRHISIHEACIHAYRIVHISLMLKCSGLLKSQTADLLWNSLVLDTQQQHHCYPRSQYRLCPTDYSCRSPLCLRLECYLLPVADQLYMELCEKEFNYKLWKILAVLPVAQHTFTSHASVSRVEAVVWQDWSTRAL